MTPTLLSWIRIGIILLLLYGVWSLIRDIKAQKHWMPGTTEEWKKFLPDVLFVCLGAFFLFWIQNNFQRQIDIVIDQKNKPLTAVYFTNPGTGARDSLAAYKGKVVILNLWATWCGPCRRELPALEKLSDKYKDRLVVIALSDEPDTLIEKFRREGNYKLVMSSYGRHPLLDSLETRPVSILIDQDNLVKDVAVGAREYGFFQKWIEPYLVK